jgi:hypothetical protein
MLYGLGAELTTKCMKEMLEFNQSRFLGKSNKKRFWVFRDSQLTHNYFPFAFNRTIANETYDI